MAELILLLGGARSGKSSRALELAGSGGLFVATAEPRDAEMAERIARHRAERGAGWELVEAPLDPAAALARAGGRRAVIDCLTLWLANLLEAGRDPEAETDRLLAAAAGAAGPVILVSNEIGLGLVPMEPLSRRFRDEQGRLNRRAAAAAARVEFLVAGLPLRLK